MVSRRVFYLRAVLSVYAVWMALYLLVGNIAYNFPARDLTSGIDEKIPLVAPFVYVYLFAYVFPFFLLLVAKDWHWINVTILSVILIDLSAYPVFLNFPVTFSQPLLGPTLSERVLQVVYDTHLRPGGNSLPSLHVALALTYCLCFRKLIARKSLVFLVGMIALLITLSTLFVKEHIMADVLAGILWAPGGWALARFLYPRLVDTHLDPEIALRMMLRRLTPFVLVSFLLIALVTAIRWTL